MKKALLAMVLISMLIVAVLVMKNMQSHQTVETSDGKRVDTIDHARETADDVENKLDSIQKQVNQAVPNND